MTLTRRVFLASIAAAPVSVLGSSINPIRTARAQNTVDGAFNMAGFEPPFPAPSFKFPDLNGQMHRVGTGQDNKFILVNFWATWCPPCVRELPSLQRAMTMLGPERFMVLAVSVDKERHLDRIKSFQRKFALTFPIMHDAESAIANMYGARQFPTTFLVDPTGNVIAAAKGERDWHSESAITYFKEAMHRYGQS